MYNFYFNRLNLCSYFAGKSARDKGERAKGRKANAGDKGQGSKATTPPVIANAVKQSRRKTPTNSPVLDCFVPRNDEKVQGGKGGKGERKMQGTRYKPQGNACCLSLVACCLLLAACCLLLAALQNLLQAKMSCHEYIRIEKIFVLLHLNYIR
ncbi:MAG: hypothetical protein LBL13_11165 [Bacteroidales bacterium]|nr:hypothetical protein [Bacteroidales bacterium]